VFKVLTAHQKGTVISSFPSTWKRHETFSLSTAITAELAGGNQHRSLIHSAEDMLHLILRTSLDFCKRKGPAGFEFEKSFRSSINNVFEQQNHLFDSFCAITKGLEDEKLGAEDKKKHMEHLLRLDKETELLVEIIDIQDELTIVRTILEQQQAVLQSLQRLYPKKGKRDDDDGEDEDEDSAALLIRGLFRALRQEQPASNEPSIATSDGPAQAANSSGRVPSLAPGPRQKDPKGKGKEAEREGAIPPADQEEVRSRMRRKALQNRDLMYGTLDIVQSHLRIVANMLDLADKVQKMVGADTQIYHKSGEYLLTTVPTYLPRWKIC